MSETQNPEAAVEQPETKVFTEDEVNRIVTERLERDRKSRDLSHDEVRALKAQAANASQEAEANKSEAQKATERQQVLEAEVAKLQRDSLVARTQVKFGISDEDAALFLTAADDVGLQKQAERLKAVLDNQAHAQRPAGSIEGPNPRPAPDENRAFVQGLVKNINP